MERKSQPLKRSALWLSLTVALVLASSFLFLLLRSLKRSNFSPIFIDRNGKLLFTELSGDGFRYPLNLSHVPVFIPPLLIAAEDENFYSHPGVDLKGIARAIYLNLKAGRVVAGGSSLTQQLSHQLFFASESGPKNLRQKSLESVLALILDLAWSKDKILEEYLNRVYFGRLAYGIEAASRQYFGKSAATLDLAEASALLALTHLPSLSDPRENLDLLKQRQKYILERGVWLGILTREETNFAFLEELSFIQFSREQELSYCLREYLLEQLKQKIGSGQWKRLMVVTTLDQNLQRESERLIRTNLLAMSKMGGAESSGAVAIDPGSGEILSYVCNVSLTDEKDSAVDLILAPRQPGSAIKPVTYLAAFGQGFTPADTLNDSLQIFYTRQAQSFVPEDFDRRERGTVTLRQALASSLNIPAVQLLNEVGLPAFFETARALGIESFQDESRYDLAITLGGGEVSLLELTTAYATLASQLNFVEPFGIKEIRDGERVIYFHPVKLRENVLGEKSQELSYLLSDVLSDNDARRLSFSEINPLLTSQKTAAKTGTTQDFRDSWTLGYNAKIVVGVWVGNADYTPMLGVSGVQGAAPIWHDLMEMFFKEGFVGWFEEPEGVVEMRQELFLADTTGNESETSENSVGQLIRKSERQKVGSSDTPNSSEFSGHPQITYPYQNQIFKINLSDDLALYQGLIFKALVTDKLKSVEWWLNDEFLGESQVTNKEAQFKWQPRAGTFQLKIASSQGATNALNFRVMQD